jgi:phage N-6-adenine-methyltransferase
MDPDDGERRPAQAAPAKSPDTATDSRQGTAGVAPYQVMPPLPRHIEAALRASIQRFGVLQPVTQDQHGNTLDGHHRARIADDLGVSYRVDIVSVCDADEARDIARTLNADRRQLTEEQRRRVVAELRGDGHSVRAIAGALGVGKSTVDRDVAQLSRAGQLEQPEQVTGLDGKQRPARRPTVIPAMHTEHAQVVRRRLANLRVMTASDGNEWYTPSRYIEAAKRVMGGVDLDPASSAQANETVRAARYYAIDDDGLAQPWSGRVWMNPPYGGRAAAFTARLVEQYDAGNVTAAVLLVSAHTTDTTWFRPLWDHTLCFTDHRINFTSPLRDTAHSNHGSVFAYLGPDVAAFRREFQAFGAVVCRCACDGGVP